MLNKYIRKFVNLKPQHILHLFDKLIHPILTYSAEVWGFTTSMITERVHLQFPKKQLGVKQCTQNDFVYGELGRTSLLVDRHLRIIKYWLKYVMLIEISIYGMLIMYYCQISTSIQTRLIGFFLVRDLLSRLGFYYVWIQQGVGNPNAFMSEVRQRLTDNFVQNWNLRLLDSIRASCHRNISLFGHKLYLECVTVKKFRIASLSCLRTSSHRLRLRLAAAQDLYGNQLLKGYVFYVIR